MRGIGATALAVVLALGPQMAEARDLAIPPCTLGEAIDIIARGTGASIGTTNPTLLRRRVPRIRVSGGVEAMLRQILGEGVVLRRVGGDAWLIVGLRRLEEAASSPPTLSAPPTIASIVHGPAIMVAASRRDASLHALPFAAQVVTGDALDAGSGAHGTDAIAERVALISATHLGPGREKLFLRGIADSSFASTRAATVAQYLGEQRLTYRAPDPGLLPYDLQQVEVLPGPRGALYGAGALGGMIRLQPRAPELAEVSAQGWGGVSTTAHGATGGDVGGVLNLPLEQGRIGLRATGYRVEAGGYIDDATRGAKDVNRTLTTGGRLALRWQAQDWTADLTGAAQGVRSRDAQYAEPEAAGSLARRTGVAEPSSDSIALASATLRREGGPVRFSATFGGVRQRVSERYAATTLDRRHVIFHQAERTRLLSAEMRAWRDADGNAVGWLAGVSMLASHAVQTRSLEPDAPDNFVHVRNDNLELNAFGEAAWQAAPGLKLTGGLRLTRVTLDGRADGRLESFQVLFSDDPTLVEVERTVTRVLPSISAHLELAGGARAFVRYERSFRPGGVAAGEVSRKFAGDRIGTLEVGVREAALGPLAIDATLAWSRWLNVQADLLAAIGITFTENVGNARVLSADIAVRAQITGRLQAEAAAMLIDDHLKASSRNIRGGSSSLPNVPAMTLRGQARYRVPIDAERSLRLDAALIHEARSVLGAGPELNLHQGPVTRLDLGARLDLGDYALSLSVENLFDARGNRFALGNPFTLAQGPQTTPQRPRTIRVGFEARF
ncbi:TonB-dependent receptor [Novosphingobium kaempferiae]|uniref:TonB-dependent receptor n=1 Tax=Novosphingobium kaempferiae TaxID=2896849 RepID=UPI001E561062|nr:TonB-dependent receptor [Novosphingobium kaempferiae]